MAFSSANAEDSRPLRSLHRRDIIDLKHNHLHDNVNGMMLDMNQDGGYPELNACVPGWSCNMFKQEVVSTPDDLSIPQTSQFYLHFSLLELQVNTA
jgi:hypothetical protein